MTSARTLKGLVRALFWGSLWLATLGLLDIDVRYTDGLHIRFRSWRTKR